MPSDSNPQKKIKAFIYVKTEREQIHNVVSLSFAGFNPEEETENQQVAVIVRNNRNREAEI